MKARNAASLPLELEIGGCPICEGALEDWARVSGYPIQRCETCGYALVNPRPTLDALQVHYAAGGHGERTARSVEEVLERERRYPNSTVDALRIVSELARIAPGARLLDVGSGYGFFSREAVDRGFQVDALELSSFECRCTRRLAGVVPERIAFEQFQADSGSYDAILMSQVIEHVVDVRLWVAKCRRLLAPAGVLAIAAPNFGSIFRRLLGPSDPMIHPPDHLNYFDSASLAHLLVSEGFEIRKIRSNSRIPGSALTRRLPPLPGRIEAAMENLVREIQRPVVWPIDRVGLGMFLNVFAARSGSA